MLPFDHPENIGKPKVFSCFQGDEKGALGRKGLKSLMANLSILHVMANVYVERMSKEYHDCKVVHGRCFQK